MADLRRLKKAAARKKAADAEWSAEFDAAIAAGAGSLREIAAAAGVSHPAVVQRKKKAAK
jgi:hypothetical protein